MESSNTTYAHNSNSVLPFITLSRQLARGVSHCPLSLVASYRELGALSGPALTAMALHITQNDEVMWLRSGERTVNGKKTFRKIGLARLASRE